MTDVTFITDRATTIDAIVDRDRVTFLIDPDDVSGALGWELGPNGLCRDSVCVPVPDPAALRVGERVDVRAVASCVGSQIVVDLDAGIVAMALPAEVRRRALEELDAPAFTLPDLDEVPHSLDEWSGLSKLLVTFASWCGCRYDLPGWQALHDELAPVGFTVIAVAMDQRAGDVRPFTDDITMPVLYDAHHVLAELYAISNVPTVVWIDGTNRIVRPNAEAFGTDTFAAFTGAESAPQLDLVRRWVRAGEVPLAPGEARRAVDDLSDDEVRARLHFRIAAEAHRRGDAPATRRQVELASALAPDDLTVWRAAMPLVGGDPFGEEFLARYDAWRQRGSPAHALPRPDPVGPGAEAVPA